MKRELENLYVKFVDYFVALMTDTLDIDSLFIYLHLLYQSFFICEFCGDNLSGDGSHCPRNSEVVFTWIG